MRDIKFRAWDKERKEMFQVYQMQFQKNGLKFRKGSYQSGDAICNLDNSELMQFTGLKDKNGKEIYEGDIFQYSTYNNGKPILFIIEWRKRDACFGWKQVTPVLVESFTLNQVTVVGNIYENPELLKGDSK